MHQPWACSGALQCLRTSTTWCARTVHVCLSVQNRIEPVEEEMRLAGSAAAVFAAAASLVLFWSGVNGQMWQPSEGRNHV